MIGAGTNTRKNITKVKIANARRFGSSGVTVSNGTACRRPKKNSRPIQMAQVMENHLKNTLLAGYASKGYNMGGFM